jgi:hypothetical protein
MYIQTDNQVGSALLLHKYMHAINVYKKLLIAKSHTVTILHTLQPGQLKGGKSI